MSPPRAAGHSGSGNEPPVRSLSGRLCRDASSSRPPSPDVGKFIRGAAFPIARAGLRRPLMRSAVECSRPAALFRAPDGLSARPGMSPPRAAGGIPAPATNRPRGACPVGFAGTHRLLSRLLRMSENSSGGTAFPTARAGLRRPQMRSAALFRPSDGFSARPGNVAAPCGGVHSGSGNEPPARSLSDRLCRDASSSLPPSPDVGEFIRGAAFPIARAGLRRPQMRPAALFRPSDGFSARPGMSPPRAAGGAFRLRQRTARAAQPRRSDAPGRRSCDRTALRKPPPRPDASRSPEARSSHGRSPPLSPESCGTPAPCGCSPVRKRLRTKHRGAV